MRSTEWLIRFVEHRIGDRRGIRLIRKWLKAGVSDEGQAAATVGGTPQSGVISPLLANIYLHYAFDLWAHQWRRRHARGDVILVRYADDIVIGFEHKSDAERFWTDMKERMARFALTLHSDKTRLIEFGRSAAANRRRRGAGKPETFAPWRCIGEWANRHRAGRSPAWRDARRTKADRTNVCVCREQT